MKTLWSIPSLGMLFCANVAFANAPSLLPVQGLLTDDAGVPVDGPHRITFALHRTASGNDPVFTDDYQDLDVDQGNFVVYLGSQESNPLDLDAIAAESELYLEVILDGNDVVEPRTALGSVAYAAFAQHCGDASMLGGQLASEYVTETELSASVDDNQVRFAYHMGLSSEFTLSDEWTALPGVSTSLTLGSMRPVMVGFSLSVSATTNDTHCNFRFVIDDIPQGDATYGNMIVMGELGQHWQSVSDFVIKPLPAGEHAFRIEGRRQGVGVCGLSVNAYSEPTIFAIGFN